MSPGSAPGSGCGAGGPRWGRSCSPSLSCRAEPQYKWGGNNYEKEEESKEEQKGRRDFGLIPFARTFKGMRCAGPLSIAGLAEATPGLGKEESWERKTLGRGNKKADEKHQARNPARLRKRVICPQGVTLDPHLGQHPARSVAPGNWGFLAPQEISKKAKVSKKGRLAPLGVLAWTVTCLLLLTLPALLALPCPQSTVWTVTSLGQAQSPPWKRGWRVQETTLPHSQTLSHHSCTNSCHSPSMFQECFSSAWNSPVIPYCQSAPSLQEISFLRHFLMEDAALQLYGVPQTRINQVLIIFCFWQL